MAITPHNCDHGGCKKINQIFDFFIGNFGVLKKVENSLLRASIYSNSATHFAVKRSKKGQEKSCPFFILSNSLESFQA